MDYFQQKCRDQSNHRKFGICDDVPNSRAYIDENNGDKWIATVLNGSQSTLEFYAIDNCLDFPKNEDGTEKKRCDGVLLCDDVIAFVELKSRDDHGAGWINKAILQLKSSISQFEENDDSNIYSIRRAYIANNLRPRARTGQAERIERFNDETGGYILYLKPRIDLESPDG